MRTPVPHQIKKPLETIPAILRLLLKDEALGGKLIVLAAILALIVANSPLRSTYEAWWSQVFTVGINQFQLSMDARHWVSEGLMTFFFLVVGLEIKREFVRGQFKNPRAAALPIGAAVGGMIAPALVFLLINSSQPENLRGWAIPIATDIAFALAVMSLLGNRISRSLKVFLLTLAVVDDIGAILVIALFYGTGIAWQGLLVAGAILALLFAGRDSRRMNLFWFSLLGVAAWVAVYKSGIHPSITGALLGFVAPMSAQARSSLAERVERFIIPIAALAVVPLFAFSSLGIPLSSVDTSIPGAAALTIGIIAGLILGKLLGVMSAVWLLTRNGAINLPAQTSWRQMIGVALLTGIGFTVSIFITELAFTDQAQITLAKLAIIIGSTLSAVAGYSLLRDPKARTPG